MPVIPQPIIIVDTREKKPFQFTCPVERRALPTGDYSIDGYTHRVSVERKSIDDFISSVTSSRKRFINEIKRLADIRRAHDDGGTLVCVVIEGTIRDVKLACEMKGVNFHSIFATAASLHASWGIPILFIGERWLTAKYTEEMLMKFNATAIKRGLSRE